MFEKVKAWYNRRWISKKKNKFASLILTSLFIVGILLCIVVFNLFSIPVINPLVEQTLIPIPLSGWFGDMTSNIPDFSIGFYLRCTGTLAAGVPAKISAIGYVNTENQIDTKTMKQVDRIVVSLKLALAYPYRNESNTLPYNPGIPASNEVNLIHINGTNRYEGNSTIIFWANPGDYAPTIMIVEGNQGYTNDFPLTNVHVEPASELQNEKYSRINLLLTYSFVYFAVVEVLNLYYEHRGSEDNPQQHLNSGDNITEEKTVPKNIKREGESKPRQSHN